MPVREKSLLLLIKPVQAAMGGNPHLTLPVFQDIPDDIVADAERVAGVMLIRCEKPALGVIFIQAAVGANP